MTGNDHRVLVVELNESHDDSIISWRETLRSLGHERLWIACTRRVSERCGLQPGDTWIETAREGGWRARLRTILRLRSSIGRERITHVLLTTASGSYQLLLLRALPRRCRVLGILHYMRMLERSRTQRRIGRQLDAYVVIGPHLPALAARDPGIPLLVVPQSARMAVPPQLRPDKPEGDFWFVVPGAVSLRRRAYGDLLRDEVMGVLPPHARVVILGNAGAPDAAAGREFRALAERYAKQLVVFDEYMDHARYHAWLSRADAVLPLLHPGTDEYDDFLTDKCSGAFSMAWAWGLPLLLERGFERFPELRRGTRFYDVADLAATLAAAAGREPAFARVAAEAREPVWGDAMRMAATRGALAD